MAEPSSPPAPGSADPQPAPLADHASARNAPPAPLRAAVRAHLRAEETPLAAALAAEARLPDPNDRATVDAQARTLVRAVRAARQNEGGVDKFMAEYALSSEEGVALMCLAESLLRIPDADTADRLIEDKIAGLDWEKHLGHADSLFVNASTLGLMISGRVLSLGVGTGGALSDTLGRLIQRTGEPVIRAAIRQAMRIMGRQFVMGRRIEEALDRFDEARGDRGPRLLRHAGRGRLHRGGRRAISGRLSEGDRGGRRGRRRRERADPFGRRLHQALGAASAL